MSTVRNHEFPAAEPLDLRVELGSGTVEVHAEDTTTATVRVEGRDADQVAVTLSGRHLQVSGPKRGLGLGGGSRLTVSVTLPSGSDAAVRTGSAGVEIEGEVAQVAVQTGSGDIDVELATGPTVLATGSGAVRLGEAGGDLRIKSGSGDVSVGATEKSVVVSTGSGDVEIGTTRGPVSVKTGSGGLRVGNAGGDVAHTTGSGDLEIRSTGRGRITGKGASGDIRIGIPAGVPVWTDLSTVSGEIRSTLRGAGQPSPGQDHVEVRARTASGDIMLVEL